MKIVVTGVAGFIGFHLTKKLLEKKKIVIGLDNLNDYYDVKLKKSRLKELLKYKNFSFKKIDISNYKKTEKVFKVKNIKIIVNLAAQAGVSQSLTNPKSYLNSNIIGFFNILELAKKYKVKKILYASSSSVYGNQNGPFKEKDNTDKPLQFYAVTKKTNELMAHSYHHLHDISFVGLRFFTAYGPWGRPDMALYKFSNEIKSNKKITLFNKGNYLRDFTYIDDVIEGVLGSLNFLIKKSKNKKIYKIFNIGRGKPIKVIQYLKLIEKNLGKKSKILLKEKRKTDANVTHASLNEINKHLKYTPKINIEEGIFKFINWYKRYYNDR